MTDRRIAREMARTSLERGDPVGWFDELYRLGEKDPGAVPWSGDQPNPHLVRWASSRPPPRPGSPALVVGCGFGHDAEWLAGRGYAVTAFDVSPTVIATARRENPATHVEYRVANALEPPKEWARRFDLVFEGYTLQVLPPLARAQALAGIAGCVGGTLLIVARGRDDGDPPGELPWPLTRREIDRVTQLRPDLAEHSFEDFEDDEVPPVRRFRVVFGPR
jgi:SAM-dependent methyltransferase